MGWEIDEWAESITIGDLLLRQAARTPDADALVLPAERRTYAQLAREARAIARGLMGAGVRGGDRVGYLMNNSPETVATLYGIALAGAAVVPINTRYRARELPFIAADARLRAIVTSDRSDEHVDLVGLLADALPGLADAPDPLALSLDAAPDLRTVVLLGSRTAPGTLAQAAFERLAAGVTEAELDQRRVRVRTGDVGILLFTSGTTAQPRACRLTHEAMTRNWTTFTKVFRMTAGEGVWAPGPMFHLGAIGPILMTHAAGGALLTDLFYEPGRALDLLAAERPAILYPAYPPVTMGITTHERFAEVDFSRARVILNVGPPDLLRQIQATFPQAVLVCIYALSEGGGATTLTSLDDDLETRVTTCGFPLPATEVRIVDPETRTDVPAQTIGEIAIRGVSVCLGYENDPEKTAAAFDADGWLHTGDRGSLDDAGRVRFHGRLKEMMKVGGENVAQVEVESHISLHPAVKLVQVVGVPDDRLEEVPAAVVELRPGFEATTEEEIVAHCRDQIARFKVPRYVRFVDAWPMSASKIQKNRVREETLEALGMVVDA
jgi:fatty-acyl-CoA synthase